MKTEFRIAVADDERDTREFLAEVLVRSGHQVVGTCANGDELLKTIRERDPELVITDIRMPQVDGIDVAVIANRERCLPFLLVSAYHDRETLKRAAAGHIVGYLIKPISEAEIKTAVTMAMVRFEQFQALLKDAAELRQALEERKIVERAKGVVMKRLRIEEDEAFRKMRKTASQHNVKLAEVCRKILQAEETFQGLEQI
jgi:AmiR/NasT family two-component response regulator